MSLHREQNGVLRAALFNRGSLDRFDNALAAVLFDELEPMASDRLEVGAAGDEGHFLTGQRQTRAQIATNGAGTDDCELHRTPRLLSVDITVPVFVSLLAGGS